MNKTKIICAVLAIFTVITVLAVRLAPTDTVAETDKDEEQREDESDRGQCVGSETCDPNGIDEVVGGLGDHRYDQRNASLRIRRVGHKPERLRDRVSSDRAKEFYFERVK